MNKNENLYIQMFSPHGLFRYPNYELGKDADTGGQVKYVLEEALALSQQPEVDQVDVFTRKISDQRVSTDYSEDIYLVNEKFRIIRIQCGGLKYIRKELLWPHLDEFIDKTIKFIKSQNKIPDLVHGHYADGGYIASNIAELFGTPFLFTGHSLGRDKLQKLLNSGQKESEIIKKFKINHRINVEESILRHTDLIITSTRQEVEEQYKLYENHTHPSFVTIPPGIDIETFYPYYYQQVGKLEENSSHETEEYLQAQSQTIEEFDRFFMNPDKPLILTLCRPDKRKNIDGLIRAFGEDKELQAMANLAIFAGIRKDILDKEDSEKDVLTEMLLLMDKYDLYGKMAIPKKHETLYMVPEIYRLTAKKKGVFVNAALTEPFGITLIEAASCGLPIVATQNGGATRYCFKLF